MTRSPGSSVIRRILRILLPLALLATAAQAQAAWPPAGHDGWTFCRPDGSIEVWFRDPSLAGTAIPPAFGLRDEVAALRAHEQQHVRDLRAVGCARALAILAMPESLVTWEARAYCAQAQVLADANPVTTRDLSGRLVARLLDEPRVRSLDPHTVLRLWQASWTEHCAPSLDTEMTR